MNNRTKIWSRIGMGTIFLLLIYNTALVQDFIKYGFKPSTNFNKAILLEADKEKVSSLTYAAGPENISDEFVVEDKEKIQEILKLLSALQLKEQRATTMQGGYFTLGIEVDGKDVVDLVFKEKKRKLHVFDKRAGRDNFFKVYRIEKEFDLDKLKQTIKE